jgi:Domain of unknown function (DUF4124)
MNKIGIALLLLATAGAAQGQAYRCSVNGRTVFQQAPCTGGEKVADKQVTPAAGLASDAATRRGGAAVCERHARESGGFPDAESLRIREPHYVGARSMKIHDEVIAARVYRMLINAKNPFGAYVGEAAFDCQLSEDERRVLRFERADAQRQPPANVR